MIVASGTAQQYALHLASALLVLFAESTSAQPLPRADSGERRVLEERLTGTTRSTHSQFELVNPVASSRVFRFDSIVAAPGRRRVWYLRGRPSGADIHLVRDSSGRVSLLPSHRRRSPSADSAIVAQRAEAPRAFDNGELAVDAVRFLLEVGAAFESAPIAGAPQTTRVEHSFYHLEVALDFRATRTSTRIRDTIGPDGHRYTLVREQSSASITTWRPARGHLFGLDHRDTITIASTGTRVISLDDGQPRSMIDSITTTSRRTTRELHGVRLLSAQNATYERITRWLTDGEYGRELRAASEGRNVTMRRTISPLAMRVRDGAPTLRDSLLSAFAAPISFRQRLEIAEGLSEVPDRVHLRAVLDSIALAAGDTAWMMHEFPRSRGPGRTTPISAREWDLVVPFLRNRVYAWDRGVDSWALAMRIVERVVGDFPMFARDPATWACDSILCEQIAREFRPGATTPASQVGLAMLALLRPRLWADSIRRHAAHSPILESIRLDIVGDRAVGPRAGFPPPSAGAPWRDWLHWQFGIAPGLPIDSTRLIGWPPRIFATRFRPPNRLAAILSWRRALTGIDEVPGLQSRYASAVSDTERVVFAGLLNDLGLLRETPEQVARMFSSPNTATRAIAEMHLASFTREAGPLDSSTRAEIHPLLLSILSGDGRWPALVYRPNPARSDARTAAAPSPSARPEAPMPRYVVMAGTTTADSLQLAGSGVTLVSPPWRAPRDQSHSASHVTVSQHRVFVWVSFSDGLLTMRPNGTFLTVDSGFRVLLVRTADGWRVVSSEQWIS